jgi:hypothetical protein
MGAAGACAASARPAVGARSRRAGPYCLAWGRWVEAETRLQETPVMLRTPPPWLSIANKNLELMQKYMAELGMPPASRSRVTVQDRLRPKPWEVMSGIDPDAPAAEFVT